MCLLRKWRELVLLKQQLLRMPAVSSQSTYGSFRYPKRGDGSPVWFVRVRPISHLGFDIDIVGSSYVIPDRRAYEVVGSTRLTDWQKSTYNHTSLETVVGHASTA